MVVARDWGRMSTLASPSKLQLSDSPTWGRQVPRRLPRLRGEACFSIVIIMIITTNIYSFFVFSFFFFPVALEP